MKRKKTSSYLFLSLFLLLLVNLPSSFFFPLRVKAIGAFLPFWKGCSFLAFSAPSSSPADKREVGKLLAENLALRRENEELRERLAHEERIEKRIKELQALLGEKEEGRELKEFLLRKKHRLEELLELELYSLFGRVIYREPSFWSSVIWIDIGEKENQKLGKKIIAKNSPVLSEGALIGVVDYVGKKQSRVTLITDLNLSVSVRAFRKHGEALYLAKGELRGESFPLWRSFSETLKGFGFNYDFPDKEGEGFELKSGRPLSLLTSSSYFKIIEEGDLLVTTGMDGVFPEALPVARVSKVYPLKEGSIAYEIEAKLSARNLSALRSVVVLPSRGFLREK